MICARGFELAPKPFLKHFSGSENCFKKGFWDQFWCRPELAVAWALDCFGLVPEPQEEKP